jgi:hypothetical protein
MQITQPELIEGDEYRVKVKSLKGYGLDGIKNEEQNSALKDIEGTIQTMKFLDGDWRWDGWWIHRDDVVVIEAV